MSDRVYRTRPMQPADFRNPGLTWESPNTYNSDVRSTIVPTKHPTKQIIPQREQHLRGLSQAEKASLVQHVYAHLPNEYQKESVWQNINEMLARGNFAAFIKQAQLFRIPAMTVSVTNNNNYLNYNPVQNTHNRAITDNRSMTGPRVQFSPQYQPRIEFRPTIIVRNDGSANARATAESTSKGEGSGSFFVAFMTVMAFIVFLAAMGG